MNQHTVPTNTTVHTSIQSYKESVSMNNDFDPMAIVQVAYPKTHMIVPKTTDMITRDAASTAIDELGWRLAKTTQGGRSWAKVARALGYTVMGDDTVVTLSIRFTPGDMEAYHRHSDNMRNLIGRCPTTQPGSTWGDEGVGTGFNLDKGSIVLNTSGVSKRFVAGLR